MGPLVNADTRDKVAAFVADAVAKGAKIECGGEAIDGKGYFYPPTVLSNVPENADCVQDEIFGPVAAIQTFRDQDDVIKRANDTEYGLASAITGEDIELARSLAKRIRAGRVAINGGYDLNAAFGGYKKSGNGREWGEWGFHDFLEVKAVMGHG